MSVERKVERITREMQHVAFEHELVKPTHVVKDLIVQPLMTSSLWQIDQALTMSLASATLDRFTWRLSKPERLR